MIFNTRDGLSSSTTIEHEAFSCVGAIGSMRVSETVLGRIETWIKREKIDI